MTNINQTKKEENIFYIALKAGELLASNQISLSEAGGSEELKATVLYLAEQFEQKNGGVCYNEEHRDYYLEIDAFAEENLKNKYESMEFKIIERAIELQHTVLSGDEMPEIGLNEETGMISISRYVPDHACSYHIEDFCEKSMVDLKSLKELLNKQDIYYVL